MGLTMDADDAIRVLKGRLGNFQKKAPLVHKAGLNAAAKAAMKWTPKTAKRRFTIQDAALKKEITQNQIFNVRKATVANLTAQLETTSREGDFYYFDVRPRAAARTGSRPARYRGKVIRSGRANNLYAQAVQNVGPHTYQPAQGTNEKAFVVTFGKVSGKTALVYRGANKRMKDRPAGKKQAINKHNAILYKSLSPGKMGIAVEGFFIGKPDQALQKAYDDATEAMYNRYLSKP